MSGHSREGEPFMTERLLPWAGYPPRHPVIALSGQQKNDSMTACLGPRFDVVGRQSLACFSGSKWHRYCVFWLAVRLERPHPEKHHQHVPCKVPSAAASHSPVGDFIGGFGQLSMSCAGASSQSWSVFRCWVVLSAVLVCQEPCSLGVQTWL